MSKLSPEQLALERARQAYNHAYEAFRTVARDLNESPADYIPGDVGWETFVKAALECERTWGYWQELAKRDRRPAKSIMGCTQEGKP